VLHSCHQPTSIHGKDKRKRQKYKVHLMQGGMDLEAEFNSTSTATGIQSPMTDRARAPPPRRQWILIQKTGKSAYWLDEEIVTSIGTDGCDILIQVQPNP